MIEVGTIGVPSSHNKMSHDALFSEYGWLLPQTLRIVAESSAWKNADLLLHFETVHGWAQIPLINQLFSSDRGSQYSLQRRSAWLWFSRWKISTSNEMNAQYGSWPIPNRNAYAWHDLSKIIAFGARSAHEVSESGVFGKVSLMWSIISVSGSHAGSLVWATGTFVQHNKSIMHEPIIKSTTR